MLRLDGIIYTIINLIILYVALRHFLVGPIQAVLAKRKSLIEGQLANAKETQEKADSLKAQYDTMLSNAKEESVKIIEQSRETAQKEYDQKMEDAQQDAAQLMERTRKNLELEKEKNMAQMQEQIAGVAMAAVGKILADNANSDINEAIYQQYIENAGGAYDTNGN